MRDRKQLRMKLRTGHHLNSHYVILFFNDTATPEIYTLSLHDALPIWRSRARSPASTRCRPISSRSPRRRRGDRKSTRLNSSHVEISYAGLCLKKKLELEERLDHGQACQLLGDASGCLGVHTC